MISSSSTSRPQYILLCILRRKMNGMRRSQSAPSIQHYANQPAITSYSSSFQYLADNFSGHYPDVEAEEEVDVEDTLIPSPSTAVHGHLEAGVGQFNTMGVEGKTIIDVVAASDSERDSFTKFRKGINIYLIRTLATVFCFFTFFCSIISLVLHRLHIKF